MDIYIGTFLPVSNAKALESDVESAIGSDESGPETQKKLI